MRAEIPPPGTIVRPSSAGVSPVERGGAGVSPAVTEASRRRSRLSILFGLTLLFVLSATLFAQTSAQRSIALTFDDLPMAASNPTPAEVTALTNSILGALSKHRAPAVGLVNESKVHLGDDAERAATLELWLKAGQQLGNHTYSHPDFNKLTLAEFTADAERGELLLKRLLPKYHQQLRFFRFPFNHAGDTEEKKAGFQKWLAQNHYEVATCTIENSDWVFAAAYDKALSRHDSGQIQKIRTAYLDYTDAKFPFFEKASLDVFGREFPQVFLLHANRLNADVLDELLSQVEKRGYRFVTLEEAQSDAAYRTPDTDISPYGPMWIYRWAPALGKKVDGRSEPEVPKWVEDLAR
ncbi:MAG: polysaccharide deacetylase family protein [Acidobacteriaceae bacterium]